MLQGDIFAKNDQVSFDVALHQPAFRIDQKAAVEVIGFIRVFGSNFRFHIVRTHNHPNMMVSGQAADGVEGVCVIAQHFGHRRFRPDHQVGLIGQRLVRKRDQLVEPVGILAGVPDQHLRNARLHQQDLQVAFQRNLMPQFSKTYIEQQSHQQNREENLGYPDRARGWAANQHYSSREQRQ